MKLHSNVIAEADVSKALKAAKDRGLVARDIELVQFATAGSRSRRMAYEIQLGTYDKTSGPTNSRHYKNTGVVGAGNGYAATYDEWGWFIVELLAIDPEAIFGPYQGVDSFHEKTADKFR